MSAPEAHAHMARDREIREPSFETTAGPKTQEPTVEHGQLESH
jgi:hypothetical protein